MRKYLTIIILITFAIVLNCAVLGILVPQPTAHNDDIPKSKIMGSIVLTSPNPVTDNPNISNPYAPSNTDKLTITNVQTNLTTCSFLVSISNFDSSAVEITDVYVNNYPANFEKDITVPKNSTVEVLLTLEDAITFANTYQIRLLSSEGQSAVFYKMIV
jgi:hypothetical protein